eukprot:TRINITY_DN3747_c0_g1_i2.p1 TRINITY_DN3747_c0_g1~~TRINITY_DN3747_c0_g1_i2.p1  ORF type:complete len:434 (+),score=120.12 TRINITY_DN3747_c0_g1_i2:96-1397(+)
MDISYLTLPPGVVPPSSITEEEKGQVERWLKLALAFSSELEFKKRKFAGRTYKDAFIGSQLVTLIVDEGEISSREDALLICRRAVSLNCIFHVTQKKDFLDDSKEYYKFHDKYATFRQSQEKLRNKLFKEIGKGKDDKKSRRGSKGNNSHRKKSESSTSVSLTVSEALSDDDTTILSSRTLIPMTARVDFAQVVSLATQEGSTLEVKTIKHHMKTFKNAFTGKQFLDWLLKEELSPTRSSALMMANEMVTHNVVLVTTKENLFKDDSTPFRFAAVAQSENPPLTPDPGRTAAPSRFIPSVKGEVSSLVLPPRKYVLVPKEKILPPIERHEPEKGKKKTKPGKGKEKKSKAPKEASTVGVPQSKAALAQRKKLEKALKVAAKEREKQDKIVSEKLGEYFKEILVEGTRMKPSPPSGRPEYMEAPPSILRGATPG